MKQIEAAGMGELPQLYHELADFMKTCGDHRHPDEALAYILKEWLVRAVGGTPTGFQWGDVFLPDGTEMRLHFLDESYFATVEDGELIYMGLPISPRAWCLMVTGSVRKRVALQLSCPEGRVRCDKQVLFRHASFRLVLPRN